MKKKFIIPSFLFALTLVSACEQEEICNGNFSKIDLKRFHNVVDIDSSYTYPGDTLYKNLLTTYNKLLSTSKTRALSPEDDAFFNPQYIVKSTESTILYGRNYIYPGAIFEGNSISNQNYAPIIVNNRNPITVSMTLAHNTPVHTSRSIPNPTLSKINDYVVDMVAGGNFEQSEKFMYSYKRFSFYDEIKSAFGTNINTRKLFSSKSESSTEEKEKIQKSTGVYVKFFQSSFTINTDIAPLSNQPIKGKSQYEPVYVNSVTYGRLGVLVFETDETYQFAESCIKKEFDRIFYNKTTSLTEEERTFFETTEFKVLVIGADSDYAVQTFKGYSHFLNLIYQSRFTEHAYGVPIQCTFAYANTHEIVETEFINSVHIEPLFVHEARENTQYSPDTSNGDFTSSNNYKLYFYRNREKTLQAYPNQDIIFNVNLRKVTIVTQPDYDRWPMLYMTHSEETTKRQYRNLEHKSIMYIGTEYSSRTSFGTPPKPDGPIVKWSSTEYHSQYSLESSPFFIKIY